MPHFAIELYNVVSFARSWTIVRREEPFGHKIMPCRLCSQEHSPIRYYSSSIDMDILSPLIHGVCNWLVGMLQTFIRASTKDWLGLLWTSLGLAGIWGVLGKRMWAREKSMDIGGSIILGQQCLDSSFSDYLCRRFHGKKKIIVTYKIENFMSWFCF